MNFLDQFAKFIRKYVLHNTRLENLTNVYISFIRKKKIKILDFGSGYDGALIFLLSQKFEKLSYNYEIHCFDFYDKEFLVKHNKKNNRIRFFNLKDLEKKSFIKNQRYDYAIISDVIHHIGINEVNTIKKIFNKISKVTNKIIIKDHFSENYFQTQVLRLIDFIGNRGTGTNVPNLYFSQKTFKKFLIENNLKVLKKKYPLVVRPKYYLFLSNPKLDFACLLKNYK